LQKDPGLANAEPKNEVQVGGPRSRSVENRFKITWTVDKNNSVHFDQQIKTITNERKRRELRAKSNLVNWFNYIFVI